jgi:predicted TIM-barrel fold metal-dependent hydrolase
MAASQIDYSVLTALPWNTTALCSENNEHILGNASKMPCFIPVCSVQPNDGAWRKETALCVAGGAVGIKVNPAWQGICLDSSEMAGLAGFCREAGVFLEIHIDHAFKPSPASAAALCAFLRSCPGVKILATHLGGLLGLYALHPPVAALLRNVWFDTAVSSTLQFVDFYIQVGLGGKVVLGSDFPFNHSHSQKQVLDGIRARGYSEEVLRRMCAENFQNLCGQGRTS